MALLALVLIVCVGGLLLHSQDPETGLKEKVALATRMLVRARMLDQSGHVSARIPGTNRVLISPGNIGRRLLTADDIVTIDLDSEEPTVWRDFRDRVAARTGGTRGFRPGESAIHTSIYRARPDVMGVIHTHPIHSLVFSVTMKPILPVTIHGGVFSEGVPVFPYVGHVNTRELGDELAKTLGSRHAVLMRMHGAAIAGNSLEQAFVAAIYLEENAEKQLWAEASGTIQPMTAEEAKRATDLGFDQQSIEKVWQYYADLEAR
jgi:ribulose-5-phosphate 4-epimerase/fuculose-1-phosphate aldolase